MNPVDLLLRKGNITVKWIVGEMLLSLLAGLTGWAYWRITGNFRPVDLFFSYVSPLVLVSLAFTQMILACRAWRWFAADQTMWVVWGGLTMAGAAQLIGAIFAQLLGVRTPLNPIPSLAGNPEVRMFGITCAGPVSLTLLLISFSLAIVVYRSFGWKSLPRWYDLPPLLLAAAFVARQAWELVALYPDQLRFARVIPWLTDPILVLVAALALTLWRSAGSMDGGLTGLCWACYGVGLLLTSLGDIFNWALVTQRLTWQQASLVNWYIWFPAYAAFALGPACQLEAVRIAREKR